MGTFRNPYSRVYYVVEGHDWSIDWDGSYISRYVLGLTGTYCRTTETYDWITRQVVHFGSRSMYLRDGLYDIYPSKRVVLTWFHGDESNPDMEYMISKLPECVPYVSKIVTSSYIGKARLMGWGVPEAITTVIPLGVDLERFRPGRARERERMREYLGIPDDAICIGSEQRLYIVPRQGYGCSNSTCTDFLRENQYYEKVYRPLLAA